MLFAEIYYEGKLGVTYSKVTLTLDAATKRKLGWSRYSGDTKQFRRDRFNLTERISDFQGRSGYIQFSLEFYPESMQTAFGNGSAALTAKEFAALQWGNSYSGSSKKFHEERGRILADPLKYRGTQGYLDYADEFYKGNMGVTFKNISADLGDSELAGLEWPNKFPGHSKNFIEQQEALATKRSEYR